MHEAVSGVEFEIKEKKYFRFLSIILEKIKKVCSFVLFNMRELE